MTKQNSDYKAGYEHGRHNNVMWGHSTEYRRGYYQGQQEYRYWNEQSAFNEASEGSQSHSEADEFGIGGVFGSILLWMFIWAPIGLIFGGESIVFKIIFWGGFGFVVLVFICWLANLLLDDNGKRKKIDKK